jgi:archaellum biogenesis protein FlaJ (TadC family)
LFRGNKDEGVGLDGIMLDKASVGKSEASVAAGIISSSRGKIIILKQAKLQALSSITIKIFIISQNFAFVFFFPPKKREHIRW